MPVITQLASLLGRTAEVKPKLSLAPDALVKLIVARDKIPDPPRVNPKGYIHVSSLIRGVCSRMLSLQHRFNNFPPEYVNGATRVMWQMGREVERHVRAQLIAALPPLQVYGQWKCVCGKRTREGTAQDSHRCSRCGSFASIYVELDLEDDEYYVTGHPDFVLILDGLMYPVEIKSLGNSPSANSRKEGFDTIKGPFVNHELQVSSYHKMLQPIANRIGIPLGRVAIILYVSKDFNGFKSPYPYKEYHIDPFARKELIFQLFRDGRAAYHGAKTMLPPRLNACSSAGTKCALGCLMVKECFALPSTKPVQ